MERKVSVDMEISEILCLSPLTSDETFNLHAIIIANIMVIVIKYMRKTPVVYVC